MGSQSNRVRCRLCTISLKHYSAPVSVVPNQCDTDGARSSSYLHDAIEIAFLFDLKIGTVDLNDQSGKYSFG